MKNFFLKLGAHFILFFVLPVFFVLSCTNKSQDKSQHEAPLTSLTPLAQRGKGIYANYCIACHNPNPRIAGSVGPDVAFSSILLLEAVVLKHEYPLGYKPKRKSSMMPDFPQLQSDIPALHAYLNSFRQQF